MLREFLNLKQKSLFVICDSSRLKLLTRLRLRFSCLNEHIFLHNFEDIPNPMCDCGSETELFPFKLNHIFLLYLYFTKGRHKLFNSLFEVDLSLKNLNNELIFDNFLHDPDKYKDHVHKKILSHTINFIKTVRCFEGPLIDY